MVPRPWNGQPFSRGCSAEALTQWHMALPQVRSRPRHMSLEVGPAYRPSGHRPGSACSLLHAATCVSLLRSSGDRGGVYLTPGQLEDV